MSLQIKTVGASLLAIAVCQQKEGD